jgi:hypothetical protein
MACCGHAHAAHPASHLGPADRRHLLVEELASIASHPSGDLQQHSGRREAWHM